LEVDDERLRSLDKAKMRSRLTPRQGPVVTGMLHL